MNEPDILLLDEPFSALDSYLKEQVITELKALLAEFPKDVILVTHSRDEAYQLCDLVAVLDAGRVSAVGPTKELFANPQSKAAAILTGRANIVGARKTGPNRYSSGLAGYPAYGVGGLSAMISVLSAYGLTLFTAAKGRISCPSSLRKKSNNLLNGS